MVTYEFGSFHDNQGPDLGNRSVQVAYLDEAKILVWEVLATHGDAWARGRRVRARATSDRKQVGGIGFISSSDSPDVVTHRKW